MTLLDILNAVLGESSMLKRTTFAASSNVDDQQMVAMANRAAQEIRDFYDWSVLCETFQVTPVDGQLRYELPDDYRDLVEDSAWETDGSRKIDLPVPRGRWFMYKFSTLTDAGRLRARLYGDEIEIHEPSNMSPFELEYMSKYVVLDKGGAKKELFTEDDDTFRLDDRVLILGTQAWWATAKTMPQADAWMANYLENLRSSVGRDNSGQTIGGSPTVDRRAPYYPLYRRS